MPNGKKSSGQRGAVTHRGFSLAKPQSQAVGDVLGNVTFVLQQWYYAYLVANGYKPSWSEWITGRVELGPRTIIPVKSKL